MMTSDDLPLQVGRARALGLDAYLIKPVKSADLFEAIARARRGHQAPEVGPPTPGRTAPATLLIAAAPIAIAAAEPHLRVLLVDDSPDNRLLIKAYLRKLPFTIDEAENGEIAVSKFGSAPYSLVLMDLQMPIVDGIEATRQIRELEGARGVAPTPIIALTASALDEDVRRCLASGFNAHVAKPVKKAVLLEAIRNATVHLTIATEHTSSAAAG
jgi:CheY-like chemotaxis protein